MKTKTILLFQIIFSYFSCSKDPAGIPAVGAQINLGNLSGTTDETGTYFFTRAMLTGDDRTM